MKVTVNAKMNRLGDLWWFTVLPELFISKAPGMLIITAGWFMWNADLEIEW